MFEGPIKPPSSKTQLQTARCCLIDSYADVESAMISLQQRLELPSDKTTLGQRIDALGKIKASPAIPKALISRLRTYHARLALLNELRCDVVHSRMGVAPIAGEMCAYFINSREAGAEFVSARLLTLDQMIALASELRRLAQSLSMLVMPSQAALPQRPSPGATAGP